ncbi:MAG: phosphoglycerate kinase [Candidatus Nanoarchaeia archaeon]|nr:phosphoglycerate kinase [Candidatus Nanoarchaeia archaeon]
MQTIKDIDVNGKKVLVRVDFNVPIDDKGSVLDDERIVSSLQTINYLIENNAKVILMSHLGRPNGRVIETLKMNKIAKTLGDILDKEIIKIDDCIGEQVKAKIQEMKDKDVALLENLRFYKEEEENDLGFAEELASLADIYVNDAFANSHRCHASMQGITKFIPSYAGFLVEKEMAILSKIMQNPEKPFVAIIGGAKADKIAVIRNLLNFADKIIVGGILANTFLKANGANIGTSKFDSESVNSAKILLSQSKGKIILPIDAFAAKSIEKGENSRIVKIINMPDDLMIGDIGPDTIALYKKEIKDAKTVVWGGPLGAFEHEKFEGGTHEIALFLSGLKAKVFIGGGESGAAMKTLGLDNKVNFISTGGGAFLEFLSGKQLPAIKALETTN